MVDNNFNFDSNDSDYLYELFDSLFFETAGMALEKLDKKATNLFNKVGRYLNSDPLDFCTYKELINYVVANKPNLSNVSKADVIKRVDSNNLIKLTFIYLDSANKPIWKDDYGIELSFVVIARSIDEEIKSLFGRKDIILIE